MTPLRFSRREMLRFAALAPACAPFAMQAAAPESRSIVALVKGDSRRKNIADALGAIDDQIKPFINRKKYVAIKVNNVSVTNQLAASHADAIHGILDYLQPPLQNAGLRRRILRRRLPRRVRQLQIQRRRQRTKDPNR